MVAQFKWRERIRINGKTVIFDCSPNRSMPNLAELISQMRPKSVPNFIATGEELALARIGLYRQNITPRAFLMHA